MGFNESKKGNAKVVHKITLFFSIKLWLPSTSKNLRFCLAKTSELFYKKYSYSLSTKLTSEHQCLKPKRIYTNKKGEEIVIFCPYLLTTTGEPFYKQHNESIYESLERAHSMEDGASKLRERQ